MINLGEEELISDLAEEYNLHISEFGNPLTDIYGRELPPSWVATLSCNLRDTSRIKLKIADRNIGVEQILLATIADRLGILIWQKTKDGHKNRNRPKSIVELLTRQNKKEDESEKFQDKESFEEWYRKTRT